MKIINFVTSIALVVSAGTSQAALFDRGGGLIYDDTLNITWLQDANYAKTSGYDADGKMTFEQANAWAANLVYFDSVRGTSLSDWRLPTVSPIGSTFNYSRFVNDGSTDRGYGISGTNSEMGFMYYTNLGNSAYCSSGTNSKCNTPSGWGLADDPNNPNDESLFANIQNAEYWSSSVYPGNQLDAWIFSMDAGYQILRPEYFQLSAWAVRDGDVAQVSAVPLPPSMILMLSGLGFLGFSKRWGERRHT